MEGAAGESPERSQCQKKLFATPDVEIVAMEKSYKGKLASLAETESLSSKLRRKFRRVAYCLPAALEEEESSHRPERNIPKARQGDLPIKCAPSPLPSLKANPAKKSHCALRYRRLPPKEKEEQRKNEPQQPGRERRKSAAKLPRLPALKPIPLALRSARKKPPQRHALAAFDLQGLHAGAMRTPDHNNE